MSMNKTMLLLSNLLLNHFISVNVIKWVCVAPPTGYQGVGLVYVVSQPHHDV